MGTPEVSRILGGRVGELGSGGGEPHPLVEGGLCAGEGLGRRGAGHILGERVGLGYSVAAVGATRGVAEEWGL